MGDQLRLREAFDALAEAAVLIAARQQPSAALEPALQAFAELLAHAPAVTVQVEPAALRSAGGTVWEPADGGLCARLHREGVRTLTFARGLSPAGLGALVAAALPDAPGGPGKEDALTTLWKAAGDGLAFTAAREPLELSQRGTDLLADIAQHAGALLVRFGGFSDAEEAAYGAAPPLLDDAARAALDDGEWGPLARRAAMTLLDLFQRSFAGRDLEPLIEAYGRLVDEMIARRDTLSLGLALGRPTGMQGPQSAPFRIAFGKRLADPARARALLGLAQTAPVLLPPWCALLPDDAGAVLLSVMEEQDEPHVLEALAGAAAVRLDQCRSAFGNRLRQGAPRQVSVLLAALRARGGQKEIGVAARALGNPSVGVRLEAIALVSTETLVAVHALPPLLADPAQKVRLAAAESLCKLPGQAKEAAAALIAALGNDDSAGLLQDRQEQAALYKLLGRLQTDLGLLWLVKQLAGKKRTLLGPKPSDEPPLFAVQGLAADGRQQAIDALEVASVSNHPPAVVAACKAAFHRLTQGSPGTA